jgi:hypothetical protein
MGRVVSILTIFGKIYGGYMCLEKSNNLLGRCYMEFWQPDTYLIQCPCCLVGAEDLQHCLFKCRHVKEVWYQLGLLDAIQRATDEDRPGSVTMEILSKLDIVSYGLPVAELVVVVAFGGNENNL